MARPTYDTSIARMAGNIAAGLVTLRPSEVPFPLDRKHIAEYSVALARDIVAEVTRTSPACGRIDTAEGKMCISREGHTGPCFDEYVRNTSGR